jgi:magnesium-transporting ATPase (P-type)
LRKSILFILPTNGGESLVILVAIIFGFTLPITPVQILWVNMISAVTLALALAFEPAEDDVMRRPPRKPGSSILGTILLWRIGFVSMRIGLATAGIFLLARHNEVSLELARTLAVTTLVCAQAFYLFNSRHLHTSSLSIRDLFTNRMAWIAVGVLAVLQLAFVYTPFMQLWFGSASLGLRDWLIPLAIATGVFLLIEVEKAVTRRFFMSPKRSDDAAGRS